MWDRTNNNYVSSRNTKKIFGGKQNLDFVATWSSTRNLNIMPTNLTMICSIRLLPRIPVHVLVHVRVHTHVHTHVYTYAHIWHECGIPRIHQPCNRALHVLELQCTAQSHEEISVCMSDTHHSARHKVMRHNIMKIFPAKTSFAVN